MSRRIDAHHHFWRIERGDYHWMPASGPLREDYLPDRMRPLLERHLIDATILVQAAPTVDETMFLLELADHPSSRVAGVVAWAPLDSPRARNALERYAEDRRVVSLRPMLQDLPDASWITRATVIDNLKIASGLGLRFDVLSHPRHLSPVSEALRRVPDLPIVIDHLSKPSYGPSISEEWRAGMTELARRESACCKLSGLVTEVGRGWKPDDFRAHVDYVLELFGPHRTMFGSDWPVCLAAASYDDVVSLAEELTSGLTDDEASRLWGGTAERFYGL
jgi:L-fuconolactonase